jgi:hypothetical protein
VNTNSYLEDSNLVLKCKACEVPPFKMEFTSLMLFPRTQSNPTERLMCLSLSQNQISLRFVMIRLPLSPLFPLVSSTSFIESTIYSPSCIAKFDIGTSNLISLSCHMNTATSVALIYFGGILFLV